MRSLCLAALFCLLSIVPVKADLHGMFIRIECNQDLGILNIGYNWISGGKLGQYMDQGIEDYIYNIKQEENSKADMILLNGYEFKEPYKYQCELAPNQKFDVNIERTHLGKYIINDGSFYVTVVEYLQDSKTDAMTTKILLDKVIIGAGGQVDAIHITAFYDNKGTDITLEQSHSIAYFMEPEKYETLIEESITEERKKMEEHQKKEEEYIKKHGDYCEQHSCGMVSNAAEDFISEE